MSQSFIEHCNVWSINAACRGRPSGIRLVNQRDRVCYHEYRGTLIFTIKPLYQIQITPNTIDFYLIIFFSFRKQKQKEFNDIL